MNPTIRQKKFLSSLLILITLNFIIKPFWIFGIDRTVQNIVGSAEYGLYFALLNFSLLFNILLDLGITNFNNREIAQYQHLLNKQLSGVITLKFLLGIFYILLTLVSGIFVGYASRQVHILFMLSINQFLLSFILYLRSNISGLQLFKTDAFLSVLDRTLMIIFCSILIWGNLFPVSFSIEWFIYAQTLAYTLTAFIAFSIVTYYSGKIVPRWNRIFYIYILKHSAPFALLILLMTFYNRVDSVMIERLLPDGSHHTGIYAAAFRLLDAANMTGYLFSVILLPLLARMIRNNENVYSIVKIALSSLLVVSVFICLIVFFRSIEIMETLYRHHVNESADVLKILMFCFIPVSITYVFGTLLTAGGELKTLNIITGGVMLCNLIFHLIFIPLFQTKGAASVSLISQWIAAIAQMVYAFRKFQFTFEKKFFLSIGIFFILSIVSVAGCNYLFRNFLLFTLVSGFLVFLISIMTGILKPRKAYEIIFHKTIT